MKSKNLRILIKSFNIINNRTNYQIKKLKIVTFDNIIFNNLSE